VYVDMEHSPLRLDALEHFIAAMIDPAAIIRKGNTQPNVAVFARFPPYPSEGNMWIAKQALDLGIMGLLFNELETKEEAMKFVPGMRKPPRKGIPYTGPIGTRGSGGGPAAWFWGVSGEEYNVHADLWPLNPQGDLLMLPMMETITGVKNSMEIAKVPGVSALYIPGGGDLSTSLGVKSGDPDVEGAKQVVLQTCRLAKIVCGARASNPAEVARRIKEGFKFITLGHVDGGLNYEAGEALRAARAELRAAGEK
jgi:4-hydroxy-2-oxoheptanedioate aldolase